MSKKVDDKSKLPLVGTKIITILTQKKDRKIVAATKINYTTTQKDSYRVFRAKHVAAFPFLHIKKEFEKHLWIAMPNDNIGIYCFCREEIKSNTIAFEVVAWTKQKNSIFVKPINGNLSSLLKFYNFKYNDDELAIIKE